MRTINKGIVSKSKLGGYSQFRNEFSSSLNQLFLEGKSGPFFINGPKAFDPTTALKIMAEDLGVPFVSDKDDPQAITQEKRLVR